jgi:L-alanine-DL-glutamate epimerase-like enolase superfamily enzyme
VTGRRSHPSPVVIERLGASALTFPTDAPEQDGTISWDSTTIVLVEVQADGVDGVGYTYGDPVVAEVVRSKLAGLVCGSDAMAVAGTWRSLQHAVRNIGRPGICRTPSRRST